MAKVSKEARDRYNEKIREYKNILEDFKLQDSQLEKMIANADSAVSYKRLSLADVNLNMVSYYVMMNGLSLELLDVKNENFLNDARKTCYRVVIEMEKIVSDYIDVPFSDYEDRLEELADYDETSRYRLIQKIGFAIDSVIDGFGKNSKWRWSFVELQGRYAVVAKNIINMKKLKENLDPRAEHYETVNAHLKLVKQLLSQSADDYRKKYELSTSRIDDFQRGINFLAALRRIEMSMGNPGESEQLKKKIDIWKNKMNQDDKRSQVKKQEKKAGRK